MKLDGKKIRDVVPHAGTWIEIEFEVATCQILTVVPHAGTWIEMSVRHQRRKWSRVVPHAGTWIEIGRSERAGGIWTSSFPTRERGLKLIFTFLVPNSTVVPHAGTWIEITVCCAI